MCIIHLKVFPSASEVSIREGQKSLVQINTRVSGELQWIDLSSEAK